MIILKLNIELKNSDIKNIVDFLNLKELNPEVLNKNFIRITNKLSEEDVEILPGVESQITDSPDYVLSSRKFKSDDTLIKIGNDIIGSGAPTIIAGPCSAESYEQLDTIASALAEMGVEYFRAGVFKPRTNPYAFQGLKENGLELLNKIKNRYGLKVVTEVLSVDKIDEVADVADILQVGSRNMFNYHFLEQVAKPMKPILLKRGMSAKMTEWLSAAEYILNQGNSEVILCERGIKTFETTTRNTLDLNAIPFIRQNSHLPIFADPSHGTGIRSLVAPMSMAALACGAQGLEIEVHNNPSVALSDGDQSLTIEQFKALYENIKTSVQMPLF